MKYPNLWNMLFNAPLMLHEPTAQHFADMFLAIQRDGLAAAAIVPQPHAYAENVAVGSRYKQKSYAVTDAGIGLLPVHGVLVQRAGQISPDCTEMTSYQRIKDVGKSDQHCYVAAAQTVAMPANSKAPK